MAVQILRAMSPCQVIGVDSRQAALEVATSSGAHHALLSGDDTATEIRDLTKGRGVDAVFDMVGIDQTMALAAAVVRHRAYLTVVGIGMGTLPFNFFTIAYEVTLSTTYWGTIPELHEVIALAERGLVTPQVETFALDEAPKAYEAMQTGRLRGRAVITPN